MTVRPDMLGVAAQTGGVFLFLRALRTEAAKTAKLTTAFALFGLAFCVKQHFVAGLAISGFLLTATKARERFPKKAIARAFLTTLAIAVGYYGAEGVVTGGRVFTSCFLVAAEVPRVHPSTWGGVEVVFDNVAVRLIGLLSLGAACVAAAIRPQGWKRLSILLGVYLIALAIAVSVARRTHSEIAKVLLGHGVSMLYLAVAIGIALACLAADRRRLFGDGIDAVLWANLVVELALMMVLCRNSTGAWMNYAAQAIVFACVIVGRALARVVAGAGRPWPLFPALIAAAVLLADDLADILPDVESRRAERVATRLLVQRLGRPRDQIYFDDHPGWNRLMGRRDLIHDDWLYPVFEAANMAEPRERWLRNALVSGPIHIVVTTHRAPSVAGFAEPITDLGYRPSIEVGGHLFAWKRD